MESKFKQYWRYAVYMFQWIFLEKARGLDFSMRDTHLIYETDGMYHGYSKTDDRHIRKIFDTLTFSCEDSFLDIGCGKGAVLREAAEYPFSKISGIEYDGKLVTIANKNFRKLKLNNRITIFEGDATNWNGYGAYNVFYYFNSFEGEMLKIVMETICHSVKQGFFIYHNPINCDVVERMSRIRKINSLYDPMKSYKTYIYEIVDIDNQCSQEIGFEK